MKASSSVVQSTIDDVVREISDLFSQIVMSLKTKTENLLENRGIPLNDPERQNLLETFSEFQHPFENLETAYQQNKYLLRAKRAAFYSVCVSNLNVSWYVRRTNNDL